MEESLSRRGGSRKSLRSVESKAADRLGDRAEREREMVREASMLERNSRLGTARGLGASLERACD
eukprot:3798329-Rhodomonas_salina.1